MNEINPTTVEAHQPFAIRTDADTVQILCKAKKIKEIEHSNEYDANELWTEKDFLRWMWIGENLIFVVVVIEAA